MSYLDNILKLSKFTESIISSQIPILETGSTGFDLGFISRVNDTHDLQAVTRIIAENIYNKFNQTQESTDIIREAIVSVVDMRDFDSLAQDIHSSGIELIQTDMLSSNELTKNQISVRPSQRYIDMKVERGVSQLTLTTLENRVKFGIVQNSYDLLGLLSHYEEYDYIANELHKRVSLYGYSRFSSKYGINIKLK